ncbi:hypothetical protein JDS99_19130 [Bacillus cereus group sp. N6]|uniref:hypothetical protein n=1 Tax=Bacillus cereus group sp. N6 TaxID=2794583 RepID=UPI0018F7C8B6|nr:hypothetical protein [Bacillus cereus group sp. N6]MBJ8111717.1 hypothetical protein [Bacillus cereus group sp. N6]
MNHIMKLTGLSYGVASTVFKALDYASYVSLLCALTGIGVGAAAAIISYRYAIGKLALTAGEHAAIQL